MRSCESDWPSFNGTHFAFKILSNSSKKGACNTRIKCNASTFTTEYHQKAAFNYFKFTSNPVHTTGSTLTTQTSETLDIAYWKQASKPSYQNTPDTAYKLFKIGDTYFVPWAEIKAGVKENTELKLKRLQNG
jgi:hypothetical protein